MSDRADVFRVSRLGPEAVSRDDGSDAAAGRRSVRALLDLRLIGAGDQSLLQNPESVTAADSCCNHGVELKTFAVMFAPNVRVHM